MYSVLYSQGSAAAPSGPTLESILDLSHARKAWHRVRRNQGAPGVDGMAIREVDQAFDELWAGLVQNIQEGDFQPLPVRRVMIPKSDGGERQLGIPTVMDRVLAQTLHLALSPVWEPTFSPMSFGYRPGRMAIQAVAASRQSIQAGNTWALHLDIKDYFDSVPHELVLKLLSNRLSDTRVVDLVSRLLRTGVCDQLLVRVSDRGITQGSPLSPLLANIVLHEFDSWLTERGLAFARYADDCLILLPDEQSAQAFLAEIPHYLTQLGLELNTEKTGSTPAHEADFLGYSFRSAEDGRTRIVIAHDSLNRMKAALNGIIQNRWHNDYESSFRECQQLFTSWQSYYSHSEDPSQLRDLLDYAEQGLKNSFPSQCSSSDRIATQLMTPPQPSLYSQNPPQHQTPNYAGQLPIPRSFPDWPASLRLLWRRLPRQRFVKLRVNLGLSGKRRKGLFRTRSVSLVICGQEFRFSL